MLPTGQTTSLATGWCFQMHADDEKEARTPLEAHMVLLWRSELLHKKPLLPPAEIAYSHRRSRGSNVELLHFHFFVSRKRQFCIVYLSSSKQAVSEAV